MIVKRILIPIKMKKKMNVIENENYSLQSRKRGSKKLKLKNREDCKKKKSEIE